MQILLTNDDGFFSPGISAMARALRSLGDVWIVAPETEQSGVSRTITFLRPLTAKEIYRKENFWGYAVSGSPVDCVKLGIRELVPQRPDLVVSGLNNGLNVGANIYYSGTVGAAFESAYQGITSIATSIEFQRDPKSNNAFERAADISLDLIRQLIAQKRDSVGIFNINIPQAALDPQKKAPVSIAPVDPTPYWNQFKLGSHPSIKHYYWLRGKPECDVPERATDLGAISRGEITVTPLQADPTHREMLEKMRSWILEHHPQESPVPSQNEAVNFRTIYH